MQTTQSRDASEIQARFERAEVDFADLDAVMFVVSMDDLASRLVDPKHVSTS